jgi:desulfoferrodoxin (superoxide reductase-like protein)
MMRTRALVCISILFTLFSLIGPAFANKSSVSIEGPQTVAKDTEITIRVTVNHKGNSFLHYTKWLKVMVNQKEIAHWDYSASQRPEAEVFTKEIKIKADENMEVTAQSTCNIHGSAGPATLQISVK